ncbi:DinB family protein [Tenacibaculum sp. SG-28]|uniref:DinB family protein n=1 Tax=Tenacibaculum sp. SG-28 TaxID=754426 RepID=UPI000CF474DD|nr:DinB family protein [Tenacibaculum sp. SG-28]PQJ21171.1 damage-inducible protein DinB [Tenacibaculum sp. SG-28]
MNIQLEVLQKSRQLILELINDLTLEQIHTIPEGFTNNIAWNVAHLVVTQQLLHYKLSGLPCLIPEDLIENYRKGTKPEKSFTEEEFLEVKELLIGLPGTLKEDYAAGLFQNYTEYPTSTGYVLSSFEKAVAFNNLHEGIHLGVIMALKKLV